MKRNKKKKDHTVDDMFGFSKPTMNDYKRFLREKTNALRKSIERTSGKKYVNPRKKRNENLMKMYRRRLIPKRRPPPLWSANKLRRRGLTMAEKIEAVEQGMTFEAFIEMKKSKQRAAKAKLISEAEKKALANQVDEPDYSLLRVDMSRLPLELYDYPINEGMIRYFCAESHADKFCRYEDLLNVCKKGRSPYYVDGKWVWRKCDILEVIYDNSLEKAKFFAGSLVRFKIQFKVENKVKVVKRLSVVLDVEEEKAFLSRLSKALLLRKHTIKLMRYNHFCNDLSHPKLHYLNQEALDQLMNQTSDNAFLGESEKFKDNTRLKISNRIKKLYDKTMQEIFSKQHFFPHDIRDKDEITRAAVKALNIPKRYIRLFKRLFKRRRAVKVVGTIFVADRKNLFCVARKYNKLRKKLHRLLLINNKECRKMFRWLAKAGNNHFEPLLFLSCSLDFNSDVDIVFEDCLKSVATRSDDLKRNWYDQLTNLILDKFNKQYNFYTREVETPATKLIKRFSVQMKAQLHSLICSSLMEIRFLQDAQCQKTMLQAVIQITETEKCHMFTIEPDKSKMIKCFETFLDNLSSMVCSFSHIEKQIFTLADIKERSLFSFSEGSEKDLEDFLSAQLKQKVSLTIDGFRAFLDTQYLLINKSLEKTIEMLGDSINHSKQLIHDCKMSIYQSYKGEEVEDNPDVSIKTKPQNMQSMEQKEMDLPLFCPKLDALKLVKYKERLAGLLNCFEIVSMDSDLIQERGIFSTTRAVGQKDLQQLLYQNLLEMKASIVAEQVHRSKTVKKEYEAILLRISKTPKNEMELVSLDNFVLQIKDKLLDLANKTEMIHVFEKFIQDEMRLYIDYNAFNLFWSLKFQPNEIKSQETSVREEIERDKVRMLELLSQEKLDFTKKVEVIEEFVSKFQYYEDYDRLEEVVGEAYALDDMMQSALKQVENFNMREKALGYAATDYPTLMKSQDDFQPYKKLWTMSQDYLTFTKEWQTGLFKDLNGDDVEKLVTEWWTQSYRLTKIFSNQEKIVKIASRLRADSDGFKQYLPLIRGLASAALKDRHWTLLSDLLGKTVFPDESLTLQDLLELNAMNYWDDIEKITVKAEKEFQLEHNIDVMRQEWADIEFELMEYKETKTFVLRGADDVLTLLDDHIVRIQTMLGSPFIKPIIDIARGWEQKLQYIQKLIEEVLKCQRSWMYLEPIFQSADIMRQIPTEARRFSVVDQVWRKTLGQMNASRNVLQVTNDENIVEKFVKCNDKLDLIQKGLNDYLEIKRMSFARFFFLSNEELLEIVSQTKDPQAVQPFLNKCFEGINTVIFAKDIPDDEKAQMEGSEAWDDLSIIKMKSSEGEIVTLSFPVHTEDDKNRGNVELWLGELELSMRITVKDILQAAMKDYPFMSDDMSNNKRRKEWVLNWPGQVVLNGSQLFWTGEVSNAIDKRSLKKYVESLNEQLLQIVHLVRGKLNKMERTTLGALSVIDLHQRDVVQDIRDKDVDDSDAFEWLSQLRYYWEEQDDDFKRYGKNPMNMMVRILNATQMYAYEYLGNSSRLVITPLTDRCYRTLMGAVSLLYGGAPAGPAGTGKTETTKDLAKAIAKHCVVFNCSDGLDYLAMAKFFKGLAQSGAWACFDEFNRIELEVLSVIAQQILTIVNAKRSRLKTFDFEGSTLNLNPDANCFITMNPGYAGRQELPDNLAALFRPCAMMVPDYALIAEIKLFSFGFEDARTMARKLTQVLVLCSEQLSNQKHYDYGMRAVFSILVRAGKLRQLLGDTWTEAMIVLSAVTDVNLPKFNTDDIPLFLGITSDLFPGVKLPVNDYGELIPTMHKVCEEWNLQPSKSFMRATVQLYETVMVRHGLMVVGEALSGKSSIVHVLKEAMTRTETEMNVKIHVMNPKSITQGQLYGSFDENTHEWTDGILAVIYRNSSKDTSQTRQWVMFDGPVDAVWIEDMNTVLDDNKKLCLQSGEIIKMSERMTMMFEAEDLNEASPATVSRVGMVFLEQKRLGHWPLVQSWVNTLPEALKFEEDEKSPKQQLLKYFELYFEPMLFLLRKCCKLPTPVTDSEFCKNCLNILQSFLFPICAKGKLNNTFDCLEGLFFFSLIWGLGGATNNVGRIIVNEFLQKLLSCCFEDDEVFKDFLIKNPHYQEKVSSLKSSAKALKICIPFQEASIFDLFFDTEKVAWTNFTSITPKIDIAEGALFTSILVPTTDTTKQKLLVKMLLRNHQRVLCTGDTGTGKSVLLQKILSSEMNEAEVAKYTYMFLNFSAQTKSIQVQDQIDNKLEKRRRGIFGPPVGKQYLIFVDDLNMPKKETYGAQPPIEILRQIIDNGGFYDLKELVFKQVVDCTFLAAMGPPGGGRNHITQRLIRHFTLINFVPYEDNSLCLIFKTILNHYFKKFSLSIKQNLEKVVEASLKVYRSVSENLLPTPAKSHYTFNLRDISKIFQGVIQADIKHVNELPDFVRLWSHECTRVFSDRLINVTDRKWFSNLLDEQVSNTFKLSADLMSSPDKPLIFCNFYDADVLIENRSYNWVRDIDALQLTMNDYLEDFNNTSPKKMDLVLFLNAIEHVTRISRVLNFEYGNLLLVGVGGSGRKSLTTLAAFICEQTLFSIEITKSYGIFEWREDMKKLFMLAGVENKETCFLFSDTEIVYDIFVEDINNILNTGQVPNLFNVEETFTIIEGARVLAVKEGLEIHAQNELLQYFVQKCRINLHVCLAFSPVGEEFRVRLRQFPSLINCCVIDWFLEWPKLALKSVAAKYLKSVNVDTEVRNGIVNTCVSMQTETDLLSKKFLNEMKRYYYVTPTSYLELLKTFQTIIASRQESIISDRNRYQNGLTKLEETAVQVADMQRDLEDLQPKLVVAQKETDKKLETVKSKQQEADVQKSIVQKDEAAAKEKAASCEKDKKECEDILSEALPILEAAVKALRTLNKNDITEIKAMKKPPSGVKLTMEAICRMLSVKPKKVPNPNGRGKIDDFWEPSQKVLLSDPKFLQVLMDFDKDNVDDKIIVAVSKYLELDEFQPEIIKKASNAAAGLCKWVHAIIKYDKVAKIVRPKKAALAKANEELQAALDLLKEKQEDLQQVLDNVEKLKEELNETIRNKEALENQVKECSVKLDRAQRLINGLGGEKSRWTEFVHQLTIDLKNSIGDVLLSAGIIAYLGCFPQNYREECINSWSNLLVKYKIPMTENFSLSRTLGDPVLIRKCVINKLPNDAFSIDNSIILFNSNRYPLMIDPQGQANRWIKNYEGSLDTATENDEGKKEDNLIVIKPNQPDFVRKLEYGISFGKAVLLENVSENLDPILDTILTKQIITKGGQKTIQLGDAVVDYNDNFRFYITTKIANPHYPPEVCVKVNLLNFMATVEGLFDQMLNITVRNETPELEAQREALVLKESENKKVLKDIENKILTLLANSQGNILDDEVLINTLAESKVTSDEIHKDIEIGEKTKVKINKARSNFKIVANKAANLFFSVADMCNIEAMYQFSLDWYTQLFNLAFERADQTEVQEDRLQSLNDTFAKILYDNVCRSLFERDKLLFSFLLCVKCLQLENDIDQITLRYFLTGNTDVNLAEPNPTSIDGGNGWLNDKAWADFLGLNTNPSMPNFKGISNEVKSNLDFWKDLFYAQDPKKMIDDDFASKYDFLERLVLLKCIRPDKVIGGIMDFIDSKIGRYFIEPPTFNLRNSFEDSSCTIPTLFILTPGADPMSDLIQLGQQLGFEEKMISVSLGQGQEKIANDNVAMAQDKGYWVVLQNCHVAKSYLATLERTIEEFNPAVIHEDFRLFMTALPLKEFPVNILQSSIKITIEPPQGIRNNMSMSFKTLDNAWFESCDKEGPFKKLCFGICFFHALVRERISFGALGFNNKYSFSIPDLRISLDQLYLFLNSYDQIPYKMLNYLAGECNYGGRVTDDKDRRCLLTILDDFYVEDINNEDYKFSPSGTYYAPQSGNLDSYLKYIQDLPLIDPPEIFGFHENAEITTAIKKTNKLLADVLNLQPNTASKGGASFEDTILSLLDEISSKIPPLFDLEKAAVEFPTMFEEAMNTVLTQELGRFNGLLAVIHSTLKELKKAVKGEIVMSTELELMSLSLYNSIVPDLWKKYSYPSLKPLGPWVNDLVQRISFFNRWLATKGDGYGKPKTYWLSGFFFIPGFLTGTRQNFARKYTIPIDLVKYEYKTLTKEAEGAITVPAADGAYIYGLFIEGARFDQEKQYLVESTPKELFSPVPYIEMTPVKVDKDKPAAVSLKATYNCPVYKTSERWGILSTTGHSTNFVMFVKLNLKEGDKEAHWIKRGVAMLTQLDV